jgi:hypothetical protein
VQRRRQPQPGLRRVCKPLLHSLLGSIVIPVAIGAPCLLVGMIEITRNSRLSVRFRCCEIASSDLHGVQCDKL